MKIALTRFPRLYELSRRPYALIRFLAKQPHDSDYAVFALFPDRAGLFLDVGANSGMSALSFRIYRPENAILSIEPNPYHARDLRFTGRLVGRFSYLICAAGTIPDDLVLYIPIYRGTPLTTEACLIRDNVVGSPSLRARLDDRMHGPDFTIAEATVPVVRLDDLDLRPDFVKLDVQGYEHAALNGMRKTIQTARPVVLVESPDESVHALMREHDYQAKSYNARESTLSPDIEGAANVVFVPRLPPMRAHPTG